MHFRHPSVYNPRGEVTAIFLKWLQHNFEFGEPLGWLHVRQMYRHRAGWMARLGGGGIL